MSDPLKPQGTLVRSLGLFSAFILTVSLIIGSGIYKKIAPMSAELLSGDLVLFCWVLAGLITLSGALSNAEVAGILADSGGEFVYFRKIYNKFFAFLFGWSSFVVIRSAATSSIAYVFSQSFNSIVSLPTLPENIEQLSIMGIFFPFENFGVKMLSVALILALSYNNYIGLKFGAFVSKWIFFIVMAGIAFIMITAFTSGLGSFSNVQTPSVAYVPHAWTSVAFIESMFAALLAAFWAYEGWNVTGFIGGEIKNPTRNLPLAIVSGVLFVIVIYTTVNLTYLYVLPIDEIIALQKQENSIAAVAVVGHLLGAPGAMFIAILIVITTFGCVNSNILGPARLYYAMAKDGLFFKSASYVHPKYNTPSTSIWMQAFWSCVLVFSGSFDQLTDMLIFASFIFYGATTIGVFILRKKMPDAPRPYKAWGYPVIPALFTLFCLALVIITIVGKPREAFLGLALMASGVPFYLYWKKSK
jgi:APA family basic amino acid/polyamine antiporter